jgi:hypothetical protein
MPHGHQSIMQWDELKQSIAAVVMVAARFSS